MTSTISDSDTSRGLRGVKLLEATLAHIETHSEDWDQAQWRCSTGMCFAGWACTLAGGTWLTDPGDPLANLLIADSDEHVSCWVDGVPVVNAELRARRLLGLTSEQASDLFHVSNTFDELCRLVAVIKAQHERDDQPARPDEPTQVPTCDPTRIEAWWLPDDGGDTP